MTTLEVIALVQLVLIPLAGFIWRRVSKRIENKELREAIDDAVRAVEEINAANPADLGGKSKADFVLNLLKKKFPKLDDEALKLMIRAAVQSAGLGASAKTPAKI